MMINQPDAEQIVIDCIRAVSHIEQVDLSGSLDDNGIVDSRVNNLITLIVHSKNIGVPSKQHRIDGGFFNNVDSDTTGLEVVDIVRDKSTPILDNPIEDFAALVAKHLALHMVWPNKTTAKKKA